MKTVEYRDIKGFPGYRVGNDGSVWSCRAQQYPGNGGGSVGYLGTTWKKLQGTKTANGYLVICLRRDGKRYHILAHRLVLETFVGPAPKGMMTCHFPNRDRMDNRLENLRWGSPQANAEDSKKHGTFVCGSRHGQSKLCEADVLFIRTAKHHPRHPKLIKQLAFYYGVTGDCIRHILAGITWGWLNESNTTNPGTAPQTRQHRSRSRAL